MLVNQMLSMKGASGKAGIEAQTIVTITPESTLADAIQLMIDKRIGAVVVSSDGHRPEGILSERDVVVQLGRVGVEVMKLPISEIMTRNVQTCAMADDALNVLERMTEGRFRHMPVVDENGNMLGLVSIGDAVSSRLKELAAEKEALTGMIMGT